MNFVCELTIGMPLLPFLLSMGKAVSSTIELVNWVTADIVNSFNFMMCAVARKCFPIELLPYCAGRRKT